jgi:ketosteroid isomerase-like protein
MRGLSLAVLSLAFLAACQPATIELTEEDVAAIKSVGPAIDQAALAGDWDALVVLFTGDALMLQPNGPAYPVTELRDMIESIGMTVMEHSLEFVDVDGHSDIAYGRAIYSETFTLEGVAEPIEDSGKILSVLRKQADGSWLISLWMWNSDLPLPPMEGEHAEGQDHT